jgi:hypothetical protein
MPSVVALPKKLLEDITQLSISHASTATISSSGISLLSTELLENVAQYLPLGAFKDFRLASRKFYLASSRLLAKTYLRKLHLRITAMDYKRIEAMVYHSTHNVWQACKLTEVLIHVWPSCKVCPENSPDTRWENTRMALCLLPESVHTVIIVPDRLASSAMSVGWLQRCEYLGIFSGVLRESCAKFPNLIIYSDSHPRMEYDNIGARMISMLGAPGLRWTYNHTQPLRPERLSIIDNTTEPMPATSLTIYAHLDLNLVGRPYLTLNLKWLQNLIITSGRMDVTDILSVLRTHRNTLRKILFHNVILPMLAWGRMLSLACQGGEYTYLTLFEIRNAWGRDFVRAMDRHVPANRIVFGKGKGEMNSVGRIEGKLEEMEEKIRALRDSIFVLTVPRLLHQASAAT